MISKHTPKRSSIQKGSFSNQSPSNEYGINFVLDTNAFRENFMIDNMINFGESLKYFLLLLSPACLLPTLLKKHMRRCRYLLFKTLFVAIYIKT